MFKKILAPIDGSAGSDRALALAAGLAREDGAELLVVYVLEVGALALVIKDPVKAAVSFIGETILALYRKGKVVLEAAKKPLEGTRFKERMELGSPVNTICGLAEREECDLIVMGSRGMSDLKGLLLGSVSHGVLQRSGLPVLLVK